MKRKNKHFSVFFETYFIVVNVIFYCLPRTQRKKHESEKQTIMFFGAYFIVTDLIFYN